MQDCGIAIAKALEILQSCTEPPISRSKIYPRHFRIEQWSVVYSMLCHYRDQFSFVHGRTFSNIRQVFYPIQDNSIQENVIWIITRCTTVWLQGEERRFITVSTTISLEEVLILSALLRLFSYNYIVVGLIYRHTLCLLKMQCCQPCRW